MSKVTTYETFLWNKNEKCMGLIYSVFVHTMLWYYNVTNYVWIIAQVQDGQSMCNVDFFRTVTIKVRY